MKAICVVNESDLAVQSVPAPSEPADDHLLVQMVASAINPGDKYFLSNPTARAMLSASARSHNVWGASGVGLVVGAGKNVPPHYIGKHVSIYRSLSRTPETIGLWCEVAQVHHLSCVILPDGISAINYAGSLVNVITAFVFLDQMVVDAQKGVVATAASSASGRALLQLAKLKGVPAIGLTRSPSQQKELQEFGFENILVAAEDSFDEEFKKLAQQLGTTAVFEGVGGDIVSRISNLLPMNSTFYFYGFLAGAATFTIQSRTMMERGVRMRGFNNFMTRTAQDPDRLRAAVTELSTVIELPAFATKVGPHFKYEQIEEAMKFQSDSGMKCLLIP